MRWSLLWTEPKYLASSNSRFSNTQHNDIIKVRSGENDAVFAPYFASLPASNGHFGAMPFYRRLTIHANADIQWMDRCLASLTIPLAHIRSDQRFLSLDVVTRAVFYTCHLMATWNISNNLIHQVQQSWNPKALSPPPTAAARQWPRAEPCRDCCSDLFCTP